MNKEQKIAQDINLPVYQNPNTPDINGMFAANEINKKSKARIETELYFDPEIQKEMAKKRRSDLPGRG